MRTFSRTVKSISLSGRHHNVIANKSKFSRHDFASEKSDAEQFRLLNNVPLYHAAHGQAARAFGVDDTAGSHLRNRSSIQKRAQAADWLSKNISMVLEQLLMHYENSYLPTHGQGESRFSIPNRNGPRAISRCVRRCSDCR